MDAQGIIVAGLVATAVFTMLLYAAPMMGMPRMDIPQILGSMALSQGGLALTMGMVMHFIMGLVFATIYAAVWSGLNISVTWWSGLIFGAIHSMVAGVGMNILLAMHKEIKAGRLDNPMKAGGAKGVAGVVLGHMVFGLVVALVYGAYV